MLKAKFQFSGQFLYMYLAEETGLNLALSETPKTGFVASRSILSEFSSTAAAWEKNAALALNNAISNQITRTGAMSIKAA